MNCIAVDDELPALYLLEDNIKRVPFLKLIKSCSNAFEAMDVLQAEKIDLIFLDIEMPELTGLDFLKTLTTRPMVIFTTAYKQYALEGYDLDVIDYLLKPIPFERFLKSVNKANEYFKLKDRDKKNVDSLPYLFIYAEYNLIKIDFDNILFIEALKDYVKIHLVSTNRPIITKISLRAMDEKLSAGRFMRVHKSFIVSIDKITSVRKNTIKIATHDVLLSESYRDAFYKTIGNKDF